jgi:serine/threonine protein kinase
LADFGLSEPKLGEDGKGYFYKSRGTPSFMAPEISLGLPFEGHRADLFALGVVLFNLVFGSSPFKTTDVRKDDPYYRLLVTDPAKFWKSHPKTNIMIETG